MDLNQAASNLADTKELQGAGKKKWKNFIGRREQDQGNYSRQKSRLVSQGYFLLPGVGGAGVYQTT